MSTESAQALPKITEGAKEWNELNIQKLQQWISKASGEFQSVKDIPITFPDLRGAILKFEGDRINFTKDVSERIRYLETHFAGSTVRDVFIEQYNDILESVNDLHTGWELFWLSQEEIMQSASNSIRTNDQLYTEKLEIESEYNVAYDKLIEVQQLYIRVELEPPRHPRYNFSESLEEMKYDKSVININKIKLLNDKWTDKNERIKQALKTYRDSIPMVERATQKAKEDFVNDKMLIGIPDGTPDLEVYRASRWLAFHPHKKLHVSYRGLLRHAQSIPQETLTHYARRKGDLIKTVERRKTALKTKLDRLRLLLLKDPQVTALVDKPRVELEDPEEISLVDKPRVELEDPRIDLIRVKDADPATIANFLRINTLSTKYDVCVQILEELQQFKL